MNANMHAPVNTAGEHRPARQLWLSLAWLLGAIVISSPSNASEPQIGVRQDEGVYTVTASFGSAQPAAAVIAVLTDYEGIPRFMPDVRTSIVLERQNNRAVVEQEAVARMMMFSKRLHLVLDVQEGLSTITFRDRCGSSFARYEGSWTITGTDGETNVQYRLAALPAFDVPEFLLKRLLKRDSARMIERLQAEIEARARKIADRANGSNARTAR